MSYRNSLTAEDAVAITPDDATALDLRGVYVGGTGDLVVTTASGDVTFKAVPVGTQIRELHIQKVKSTGTTATQIVGFK